MAATRLKTSSDSKRGNFEEDDVQMPLKLVKELLKQQESTLKVFLSAYMDSVDTRIDNLMKDVQSVKSSLEFTQGQVEELITSDLRVKEVKVQTWQESESKIKHLITSQMPEVGNDFVIERNHRVGRPRSDSKLKEARRKTQRAFLRFDKLFMLTR